MIAHQPGCMLDSVHWFRHAVAAAGRLAQEEPDPQYGPHVGDVVDMLAHFAELEDWEAVTLRDVANHASFMNQERFKHMCTCGAFG